MEQEQILSTLKEKVGQTSLADRTFSEYISLNLPGEGIEPDDAYWNKHVAIMKSLNGNFSHSVASEINKFKESYKPEPPTTPPSVPPGDKSELEKRLEAIEAEREKEKVLAKTNSLRSDVKSKAESLKVSNKAIWNDISSSIEIKETSDTETLLSEVKKAYERKLKEYMGDGAVPYGGNTQSVTQKMTSEDILAKREEFKKKKQAQGRLPKEQ